MSSEVTKTMETVENEDKEVKETPSTSVDGDINKDAEDTSVDKNEKVDSKEEEDDNDLEDGEIDDSDDDVVVAASGAGNDSNDVILCGVTKIGHSATNVINPLGRDKFSKDQMITIDLSNDTESPSPTSMITSSIGCGLERKMKQGGSGYNIPSISLIEDDHASNIENALANVLKKRGIDPIKPKIMLQTRIQQQQQQQQYLSMEMDDNSIGQQSKSSRRRKRKRQKEEFKERCHYKEKVHFLVFNTFILFLLRFVVYFNRKNAMIVEVITIRTKIMRF